MILKKKRKQSKKKRKKMRRKRKNKKIKLVKKHKHHLHLKILPKKIQQLTTINNLLLLIMEANHKVANKWLNNKLMLITHNQINKIKIAKNIKDI
ncbi:hypothetical protein BU582_00620 [Staphylococcus agnetis]|nr:hypothetical protein BU582_00620 [Staphylococcus agnetis]